MSKGTHAKNLVVTVIIFLITPFIYIYTGDTTEGAKQAKAQGVFLGNIADDLDSQLNAALEMYWYTPIDTEHQMFFEKWGAPLLEYEDYALQGVDVMEVDATGEGTTKTNLYNLYISLYGKNQKGLILGDGYHKRISAVLDVGGDNNDDERVLSVGDEGSEWSEWGTADLKDRLHPSHHMSGLACLTQDCERFLLTSGSYVDVINTGDNSRSRVLYASKEFKTHSTLSRITTYDHSPFSPDSFLSCQFSNKLDKSSRRDCAIFGLSSETLGTTGIEVIMKNSPTEKEERSYRFSGGVNLAQGAAVYPPDAVDELLFPGIKADVDAITTSWNNIVFIMFVTSFGPRQSALVLKPFIHDDNPKKIRSIADKNDLGLTDVWRKHCLVEVTEDGGCTVMAMGPGFENVFVDANGRVITASESHNAYYRTKWAAMGVAATDMKNQIVVLDPKLTLTR
jgi:hypothetical protein